jgi:hypothetical protein
MFEVVHELRGVNRSRSDNDLQCGKRRQRRMVSENLDYGYEDSRFILVRPFCDYSNPIFLLSCAVHFLVQLRARKHLCCSQAHSLSLE